MMSKHCMTAQACDIASMCVHRDGLYESSDMHRTSFFPTRTGGSCDHFIMRNLENSLEWHERLEQLAGAIE